MVMFYCGRCQSGYTSYENWELHYDRPNLRRDLVRGGGLVPNPCYKQDEIDKTLPKIWGKNLKTAVSEFNSFSKNAFFKSGSASASTSVTKCSSSVDPKVQTREPSAKRARVNSESQSDSGAIV